MDDQAEQRPREFLVGIDSDGCVFDTMEVKHKECFIPAFVNHFGLAAVSKYAREVAEFVNLYSADRGINRFPGYLKVLDLLADHEAGRRRGHRLPAMDGLRAWVAAETRLANPALRAEAEKTGNPDLKRALAWSEAVNSMIAETVREVPPFPFVRECLESLKERAEIVVVSATPSEALRREWEEHGLAGLVSEIYGQEHGTKREILLAASRGRYTAEQVLMVGDAPGDKKAAEAVGAAFFPINPGAEDGSWQALRDEGIPRFFAGTFRGAYAQGLLDRFMSILPTEPPWRRSGG